MSSDVLLTLPGVRAKVEILTDRWGVPHIYAENTEDLFFGQGYQAAKLRLWQMDTWRRRGLGQVAEVFGAQYLKQDVTARLLLYRGDIAEEARQYGEKAYEYVSSFAAGINAYVDALDSNPAWLPPEFSALDYRPARWSVEDIFRIRAGGRHENAREEIVRGVTLHRYGAIAEALRKPLAANWVPQVPEGLDLEDIEEDLLVDFNQFMAFLSPFDQNLPGGSNHWVVSGAKTATGRPVLANDPHRDMTVPNLRFACHLSAPGIDVIGGTEPYRPGISTGHNNDVAFGLTIFPCDQEDIYVYETSADGLSYRYRDNWLPFEVQAEEFAVKGQSPVTQHLKFTRHGPVVAERPDRRRAYGLRAAWLQPGGVPYLHMNLRCMFAKSGNDVRDVAAAAVSPGINLIFADRSGNIGLRPAGVLPRRPNWDGLLPVPGDGRYEWAGLQPLAELLDIVNPEQGWVGNGNECNVLAAVEAGLPVCLEPEPSHRYNRISQALSASKDHSTADSLSLQMDVVSLPAIAISGSLKDYRFTNERAEAARQSLVEWNGVVNTDSRPAALYEIWWRRRLLPELMRLHLAECGASDPDAAVAHILKNTDSSKTADGWLHLLESSRSMPSIADVMEKTLLASVETLADAGVTTWGDLHKLALVHPLTPCLTQSSGLVEVIEAVGKPVPVGGDGDTVNNTGFSLDWHQRLGASLRQVHDVGAWDNCLFMGVPGQSGDPSDPHFNDLSQGWHAGVASPLLFSRQAVEDATASRVCLVGSVENVARKQREQALQK